MYLARGTAGTSSAMFELRPRLWSGVSGSGLASAALMTGVSGSDGWLTARDRCGSTASAPGQQGGGGGRGRD